jgi:hypothetical protein
MRSENQFSETNRKHSLESKTKTDLGHGMRCNLHVSDGFVYVSMGMLHRFTHFTAIIYEAMNRTCFWGVIDIFQRPNGNV